MNALEVRGLRKTYPAFTLKDVSFDVPQGAVVGFIGRNGAGKSTTLKSILGLVHPDGGDVRFFGQDVRQHEREFKEQIGVVLGGIDFYPKKKVKTITDVTRRFYRNWGETKYRHYLELFGIDESKRVDQLSSGMKVKYLLALALSHNAKLLILDEPTSGLSPDLDRSMMELCRKLSHQNCTVLMVTHNMSNINLCDKIAFLGVGGVLCYYGAPEQLNDYFDVEMTSDIFEKLRDAEQVELYRRKYFTTPEINRLLAACPEAAQEADKRCSQ